MARPCTTCVYFILQYAACGPMSISELEIRRNSPTPTTSSISIELALSYFLGARRPAVLGMSKTSSFDAPAHPSLHLSFNRPPRFLRPATESSRTHLLAPEPHRREDAKHDEQRQNNELCNLEGRLGLRRGHLFKGRHLHEKLHDQDEDIQIQGNH